jgi:hypothetical protein
METERVERAYTWHKAKDKDCKESELGRWSGHTSPGIWDELLREIVFLATSSVNMTRFSTTSRKLTSYRTFKIEIRKVNGCTEAKQGSAPYRIVRRPASAQQSTMTLQVKIKFRGVRHLAIYHSSRLAIPTSVTIALILREESG